MAEALSLDQLRALGAADRDPVRFRYLVALQRRMAGQPEPVRAVLAQRWAQAAVDLAGRLGTAPAGGVAQAEHSAAPLTAVAPSPASLLAALSAYLNQRSQQNAPSLAWGDDIDPGAMNSVRRFSSTRSRLAAEQQLAQSMQRGPENAGPLNSHQLTLRALRLMQNLSPDYLGRFVSQADTLLWLEHAQQAVSLGSKPGGGMPQKGAALPKASSRRAGPSRTASRR